MSERPVRTTRGATRGLSVQDVEGEESLEIDEAEEYIDEVKLDEARAEERDEDWQEPSKRRKKKKKAKEPVTKDRGKLKHFQALPLDLVGEICSYLSPLDLLYWGRASKPFRQLFFTSSSASLWRLARKSVDLPDLTWPMPEPEYASLMYEKHCMDPSCDKEKPSLPRYDFYHRLRLCGTCARATFALLDNVAKDTGQVQLSTVKRCYVSFKWNPFEEIKISNRTCLKSDISSVNRLISNALKSNFLSLLQGKGRASSEMEKRILEVQAEIKAKEEDGDKLREWRTARLAEIEEQEEEERLQKCRERKAAIEAKFIAEDWDPIDFEDDEWTEHELVDSHKKLTPADWRSCREELTTVLNGIRQYRLEREAEDRMYERMNEVSLRYEHLRESRSDELIFPSKETFMRWECLEEIYQEEDEIDDDCWDTVQPAIEAQLTAYRLEVVRRFTDIASDVIDDYSNVQNYLASQSLTFDIANLDEQTYETRLDFLVDFAYLFPHTCSRCDDTSHIPETFEHECDRTENDYSVSIHLINQILDLIIGTLFDSTLANKVPLHTSDLDDLGQAFECTRCEGQSEQYDWRSIIDHVLDYHPMHEVLGSARYVPPTILGRVAVEEESDGREDEEWTES